MTELPLSVNDYEKSVSLVNLLTMKKKRVFNAALLYGS